MDVTPPQAPTSRAFDLLMGRVPPPLRPGMCEVLADYLAGDDVDGPLPGLICEVDDDHDRVRVAYVLHGDVVESTLHASQVRQLTGRPPAR